MKKSIHPVIPAKAGIYINIYGSLIKSGMTIKVTSQLTFRRIFYGFFSLTTYYLLLTTPVHAACVEPGKGVQIGECFGFGDITSLGQATSRLVMPIFSLAAVAVIIYFLFGAFKYLVSRGNKEEVEASRQMITHSIIGFIILMFAFLILQFLLSSLFGISGFLIQN